MKHIHRQRYRPVEAPKQCDQCGATPCGTWSLCRRFRQIERDIRRQREREWERMKYEPTPVAFAESTIAATKYLQRDHPERLREWFDQHPGLEFG